MQNLDTTKVINEVRKRPCLWNKSGKNHNNHKLRKLRATAWEEVAEAVVDGFSNMDSGNKFGMVTKVQLRWKHVRDSFHKVRNTKKMYSYVHYDQLQFLEKFDEQEDVEMDFEHVDVETTATQNSESELENEASTSEPAIIVHKKTKFVHKKAKTEENLTFVDMVHKTSQKLDDTDFSFFNSILSMVQELSCDEKLYFRSKIIEELINLRNKQKQSH